MAFCPRCGAPTTAGQSFCGSCGEKLAAGIAPPPPPSAPQGYAPPPQGYAPPTPAPGAVARGPPGRVREPMIVVVLAVVTLGIYGIYYWWVVSREIDDYTQRPGNAHKLVRMGTIISLVAGVILLITFVSFIGTLIASGIAEREPTEEEIVSMVLGGFGILLLAGAAAFAGSIIRLVGKWRLWNALEEDERQRGHAAPLSAGLMLALIILGWFVPFVGFVLPLVVLYMTQDHINQAWHAAAAPLRG